MRKVERYFPDFSSGYEVYYPHPDPLPAQMANLPEGQYTPLRFVTIVTPYPHKEHRAIKEIRMLRKWQDWWVDNSDHFHLAPALVDQGTVRMDEVKVTVGRGADRHGRKHRWVSPRT